MTGTVVTILTGGRPALLRETVASLAKHSPEFVERSRVVALVNGPDEESVKILDGLGWVDKVVRHPGPKMLGIGPAISKLMESAELDKSRYLFHLEDDWRCERPYWFTRAKWLLDHNPKVGQVRIRKWLPVSHPGAVSRYHMVTHGILNWSKRRHQSWRYMVARAHFTFNPTLTRTSAAAKVYPCTSERNAAGLFHATNLLAAQLLPGAFAHIGGGDGQSMRLKTGSK